MGLADNISINTHSSIRIEGSKVLYFDPNEDNKKVSCDVALIPIGGTYTMDKKHAADFIAEIGPQVVIPTHYGSVIGKPTDGNDLKELLESMGSKVEVAIKIS